MLTHYYSGINGRFARFITPSNDRYDTAVPRQKNISTETGLPPLPV